MASRFAPRASHFEPPRTHQTPLSPPLTCTPDQVLPRTYARPKVPQPVRPRLQAELADGLRQPERAHHVPPLDPAAAVAAVAATRPRRGGAYRLSGQGTGGIDGRARSVVYVRGREGRAGHVRRLALGKWRVAFRTSIANVRLPMQMRLAPCSLQKHGTAPQSPLSPHSAIEIWQRGSAGRSRDAARAW